MTQKRLIVATVALALAISTHAMAEKECVGGTLVTANKYGTVGGINQDKGGYCKADGSDCNGKTFCVSDGNMPWWSYFLWCQANGRTVAKVEDMCPGISNFTRDTHNGACANLTGIPITYVWAPLQEPGTPNHFFVYGSGVIKANNNTDTNQAICE